MTEATAALLGEQLAWGLVFEPPNPDIAIAACQVIARACSPEVGQVQRRGDMTVTSQGKARSRWLIEKSGAVAAGGMVTAMQPLAAAAGAAMLRRGGNAIDAAVAITFAVGGVEPFMSGVGGIAFLVSRDGATGKTLCLDGSTALPAVIRPELFALLPGEQRAGMYGWRATRDDTTTTGCRLARRGQRGRYETGAATARRTHCFAVGSAPP